MLSILAAVALLAQTPASQTAASSESAEMQRAFLATAAHLRAELKDSESARFRNTYLRTTTGIDGRFHHSVCGEINSKNSFGGYTGWTVFFGNDQFVLVGPDSLAPAACSNPKALVWRRNDLSATMTRLVSAP